MFVDADIQFRAEDIVKLVAHDRDIVGGIYPKTLPQNGCKHTEKRQT